MDLRHRNGAAAELYAAARLAEMGYGIYYPLVTQSRCDFLMETQEGFKKIQVKKATLSSNGTYKYLQARLSGKNKETHTPYTAKDVDYFLFTDMHRIWLAPFAELEGYTSVCLDSSNPNYKPQTKYDAQKWLI